MNDKQGGILQKPCLFDCVWIKAVSSCLWTQENSTVQRQILAGEEWRNRSLESFSLIPIFWDPDQREEKYSLTSKIKIHLVFSFPAFSLWPLHLFSLPVNSFCLLHGLRPHCRHLCRTGRLCYGLTLNWKPWPSDLQPLEHSVGFKGVFENSKENNIGHGRYLGRAPYIYIRDQEVFTSCLMWPCLALVEHFTIKL